MNTSPKLLVPWMLAALFALCHCKTEKKHFDYTPPPGTKTTQIPKIGQGALVQARQQKYQLKVAMLGYYRHIEVIIDYGFPLSPDKKLPFKETDIQLKIGREKWKPSDRSVITPLRGSNHNHRSKLVFLVRKPRSKATLILPDGEKKLQVTFRAEPQGFQKFGQKYMKIKTTASYKLNNLY